MPSTALLMSANGDHAVHAYRPDEERTLCGLLVVDPEDREGGETPPSRSADITNRRFYNGLERLICGRCSVAAGPAREEGESVELPLRIVQ